MLESTVMDMVIKLVIPATDLDLGILSDLKIYVAVLHNNHRFLLIRPTNCFKLTLYLH